MTVVDEVSPDEKKSPLTNHLNMARREEAHESIGQQIGEFLT